MSKTNDGGPEFPRPVSEDRSMGDQPDGNTSVGEQEGMSLRDWLAGQALAGIVGNPTWNHASIRELGIKHGEAAQLAAAEAYRYADAMLEARK